MSNPNPSAKGQSVEFLFLASHGLLSPISAIRWGCNRLKRTDMKKMSKEQRELVDHIHDNARVLSKLFGSMLLLARNEDRTYTIRSESIVLKQPIQTAVHEWEEQTGGKAHITCDPSLSTMTDGAILEAIIQNVLSVFAEAGSKKVTIEAQYTGEGVELTFAGAMEIPFLHSVRTMENLSESRPIVGGTPGLLLSLSQALIGFLEGTLDMREESEGNYIITAKLLS